MLPQLLEGEDRDFVTYIERTAAEEDSKAGPAGAGQPPATTGGFSDT